MNAVHRKEFPHENSIAAFEREISVCINISYWDAFKSSPSSSLQIQYHPLFSSATLLFRSERRLFQQPDDILNRPRPLSRQSFLENRCRNLDSTNDQMPLIKFCISASLMALQTI
jgi:hypothetical protein